MANACTAKPGPQLASHQGAGGLSTTSPCWGHLPRVCARRAPGPLGCGFLPRGRVRSMSLPPQALTDPIASCGLLRPWEPAHFLVFSSQAPVGPWLETPGPRMGVVGTAEDGDDTRGPRELLPAQTRRQHKLLVPLCPLAAESPVCRIRSPPSYHSQERLCPRPLLGKGCSPCRAPDSFTSFPSTQH